MPQPWESQRPYPRPFQEPRGWSEPVAYRDSPDSSEFSYVTFDVQSITVPISVCVAIMVGYVFIVIIPFIIIITNDAVSKFISSITIIVYIYKLNHNFVFVTIVVEFIIFNLKIRLFPPYNLERF